MRLINNLQVRLRLILLCLCFLLPITDVAVLAKISFGSRPDLSEETIDKKVFEVCRIQVKARPDKVWEILTDYRNSPNIFPTMRKCEILQDKGRVKVMRQVIHPVGYPGTFDYVVEVTGTAPKALEWHRVSGAFREVDGYWKLEPAEGGRYTNVTYSAYINGGILFPSFLIRGQMKDDLPSVLTALKTSSEVASPSAEIARRLDNTNTPRRGIIMQPAYAGSSE